MTAVGFAVSAQVWLELYRTPSEEDRELISEVFQSWYMLGRLGGFNGMNMQVSEELLRHKTLQTSLLMMC